MCQFRQPWIGGCGFAELRQPEHGELLKCGWQILGFFQCEDDEFRVFGLERKLERRGNGQTLGGRGTDDGGDGGGVSGFKGIADNPGMDAIGG